MLPSFGVITSVPDMEFQFLGEKEQEHTLVKQQRAHHPGRNNTIGMSMLCNAYSN